MRFAGTVLEMPIMMFTESFARRWSRGQPREMKHDLEAFCRNVSTDCARVTPPLS
jgi:hypothetical protein